ncbi:adenylate/guanylate cyclase domain-containing protein [Alcaligenaceae bacterium]|nr:adenylate/guanylate cyclase domain-containing protein [Alcaligenaceae bacterium]
MRLNAYHVQALLLALTLAWLLALSLFQPWAALDGRLGDILGRQHVAQRQPPSDIILINIDQASLDDPDMLELAGNWPWPRAIHGELLGWLAQQQPKAIVFDLIFSEPDRFRLESDQFFEQALREYPAYLPLVVTDGIKSRLADLPPIMGARAHSGASAEAGLPLIAPKAVSPDVWRTGLINFLPDPDGIGRRYWLHYPEQGWSLPSLPARVAADLGVLVPEQEALHLHFYGSQFKQISYAPLFLESLKQHPEGLPDLQDKVIIIGSAAPGLHDLRPTPLGPSTPGPFILATALSNLLYADFLRPVSPQFSLWAGVVIALLLALATYRKISPLRQGGWLLGGTLALIAIAYGLLDFNYLWLPYSTLLTLWLFFACCTMGAYVREYAQRERNLKIFGRFLDPRVVASLTDSETLEAARIGGSREISVLFSDIRGFTSLSENTSPEELIALLNRYFDTQVEAIFHEGGTLDKFIGDAIMAFWGAPLATDDHAPQAVRAALEMQRRLLAFQQEPDLRGSDFDIGIGIHTGPAVVGLLGSEKRLDYTAIGDTVNLASRIEGKTRDQPKAPGKEKIRILVSQATRDACELRAPGEFEFDDEGYTHVKGRLEPVYLYEPKRSRS